MSMQEVASGVALWRQVADGIERGIADGRYAAGEKLPGEMEIAETYRVNRHTVRRALAIWSMTSGVNPATEEESVLTPVAEALAKDGEGVPEPLELPGRPGPPGLVEKRGMVGMLGDSVGELYELVGRVEEEGSVMVFSSCTASSPRRNSCAEGMRAPGSFSIENITRSDKSGGSVGLIWRGGTGCWRRWPSMISYCELPLMGNWPVRIS